MKNKFNKIVSIILMLAMLFSIMPTSVFGYKVNSGSEVITDASSGGAVGWGGINEDNYHGMLFSLYFAEGNWASEEEFNAAVKAKQVTWQRVGEEIYMVAKNVRSVTDNLYSRRSVMGRMGTGQWDVTIWHDDWSSIATGLTYYNFKGEFPMFKDKGKDKYIEFFTGFTSNQLSGEKGKENWAKADLTNTKAVIDKILRNAPYKITEDQFRYGIKINPYCQEDICMAKGACQGHSGVYKLYFEPFLRVGIGNDWYVMTVRDFAAWQKAYPNQGFGVNENGKINTYYGIATASTTPLLKIGNETFLVTDEPQIFMKAHSGGVFSMHYRFATDKPFYQSAGVGVITTLPAKSIQRPQLIKTYVSIDKVDPDGTVHFVKARPTTIEEAPFYTTAEGNYTDYPMFYDVEMPTDESSVAVLNDIFTTDKDLQISDLTEWVDTELITNTGNVRLQPTAEDVAVRP